MRGADVDRWAFNRPPSIEERPEPNPLWVGFNPMPDRGMQQWRTVDLRSDPHSTDDLGFHDRDGSWIWASELLGDNLTPAQREGSGWHVRKEGTTGQPVGRPAEGISDPRAVDALYRVAASTTESITACRSVIKGGRPSSEQRTARAELSWWVLVLRQNGANVQALASLLDCRRGTIYDLEKNGRKPVQNSPISEGDAMSVPQAIEERFAQFETRIGAMLDEHQHALERNSAAVFETLYAFRFGETPAESWERVLGEDGTAA